MEKHGKKLVIIASLSLIIILLILHYVFNIYETTIETKPENLFADKQSVITISVTPVNAFGFKVPFRKIPAGFEISEGKDLVDIIQEDDKKGSLVLRAKEKAGKVVIFVRSKYSLLPSLVEIYIYPNTA